MASLICEILNEHTLALEYLGLVVLDSHNDGCKLPSTTELTHWVKSCGDPKVVSWVLGACCRARVYVSLGQTQNAIDSCELASAMAEHREYWLLQALALRDLWMATAAVFGRVSCERRLGACLRKLPEALPSELDTFLNTSFASGYALELNFNSASLMAACF